MCVALHGDVEFAIFAQRRHQAVVKLQRVALVYGVLSFHDGGLQRVGFLKEAPMFFERLALSNQSVTVRAILQEVLDDDAVSLC